MAEKIWIRTDEAEDVAASIRHALRCFDYVSADQQTWKWIILALHSAIQGACVCHVLTTAHPVGAVTEKNTGEWLSFFEYSRTDPNAKAPRTRLMALPDLLKEVRKPHSAGDRSNELGVQLSDDEMAWLKRIHDEIRNQFVHFAPLGWSIDVGGVPDLAKLIARLIRQILDFGWAFRHQNASWKAALSANLERLEAIT